MQTKVLEGYLEVLRDLEFLIQEQKFAFLKKEGEKSLDSFHFSWLEINHEPNKTKPKKIFPSSNKEKNVVCQLCPDRQIPIKNFFHKGILPILILHYTAEFRKNQKTTFKSDKSILKNPETEDILNRLLYKVFSKTLPNFYFQEYPACIFNQNTSEGVDWKNRVENCWTLVEDTILKEKIQGIILTGGAAVLKYGLERAKELTGIIQELTIHSKKIPIVVLRSPDALLSLEKKRKQYEKNKNSLEYQKAREEEQEIKQSTLDYMFLFKKRLGL